MSRSVVVVGVDGSRDSLIALHHAAAQARLLSADLRIVTAWNEMVYQDAVVGFHPETTARRAARDAALAEFDGAVPAWVTESTTPGPAGPALVAEAVHAQLLVVGTRGHSPIGGLLLGSVSTYCAEHSRCPVLVVPTHATDRPADEVATEHATT
ncbi:universal stress protein [Lacisediminihabitans changchengi]|uniref:Universal stress protein n=1 Tax=Lacisediminihabitans changchengi TaxID=2787634 RepID=A0A934SJM4_9MICO|nr:universal stress protein [Lacisediminihabitans changchengi]MBK4346975.1 universal stress protein [Lacisediminihabitans changchengi]MBK4347902.1 universal stress protein [Lacisediminihabitans changchengi]